MLKLCSIPFNKFEMVLFAILFIQMFTHFFFSFRNLYKWWGGFNCVYTETEMYHIHTVFSGLKKENTHPKYNTVDYFKKCKHISAYKQYFPLVFFRPFFLCIFCSLNLHFIRCDQFKKIKKKRKREPCDRKRSTRILFTQKPIDVKCICACACASWMWQ